MKPCVHASLVEAAFDGRLGERQQASMDRHFATCTACRDALAELHEARAVLAALSPEISPLDHQRARLALLAASTAPARRSARRFTVAILAAAAVLVPLIVWGAARKMTAATVDDEPTEISFPVPLPEPPAPKPRFVPPVESEALPKEKPPAASTPTRSNASRDFAAAMDAVARGDFGAGASLLDRFVEANPHDARAEEALYVEAIALERAGRKSEARSVARRYLSAYPNGSHAAHARELAD